MKRILFLVAIALITMTAANSFAADTSSPTDLAPLHVDSVVFTPNAPKPGSPVEMKIEFHVDPGYHAYVNQFRLRLERPKAIRVGQFDVEPTTEFLDPLSHQVKMGVEGKAQIIDVIDLPETVPAGEMPFQLRLTYQACGVKFCLFPKTVPLNVQLTIAGAPGGAQDMFTRALSHGWLYALIVVFIAGILTSLTPCIFPMIPITLAILGTKDHRHSKGFLISSSYVLGIALTYAILGVIAAKTGAMFGSILGRPLVVGTIAAIFVLMGLSMYGLFEIRLPSALTHRLASTNQRQGFIGAFASGLLAGVVASPCVGPVLISVLAFVAQKQNPAMGFVFLFVFALGFGQLFLLIGTSQALWQKLPRSGPWMNKVKYVFGTLMIAMAAYYVRPILPHSVFYRANTESAPSGTSFTALEAEDHAAPNWVNYSDKLLATAVKEKKPVIVDFSAEWCLACAELDKYTYSNKAVLELGHSFVWLRFDATSPSETLKRLQKKYGIGGLPFVLFIDKQGRWRRDLTLTGFESAPAFLQRMKSALNSF